MEEKQKAFGKKVSDFRDLIKHSDPIIALAPMADVTDAAFRQMFALYGPPDLFWTEFVSADGLFLAPEQGRKFWLPDSLRKTAVDFGIAPDNPLLKDLIFSENERPIIAQFFSRDPERMEKSAALAVALGFDGIDINMGCPAKVIVRQGAGCALIKEPDVAREIIRAASQGTAGKIPVSVKTRTGFNNDSEMENWLSELLQEDISLLTVHARTRSNMSKVPARWENISQAVRLRDSLQSSALLFGNGDVTSCVQALEKALETGADGIMIGRGIFGNPWLFNKDVKKEELPSEDILRALQDHIKLFDRLLGDTKNFYLMKKHFKSYLSGLNDIKTFRQQLVDSENAIQALHFIDQRLAVMI